MNKNPKTEGFTEKDWAYYDGITSNLAFWPKGCFSKKPEEWDDRERRVLEYCSKKVLEALDYAQKHPEVFEENRQYLFSDEELFGE